MVPQSQHSVCVFSSCRNIFGSNNTKMANTGRSCKLATFVVDNLYWSSQPSLFKFFAVASLDLVSMCTNSTKLDVVSRHDNA